jgi:response regulator RpfG family c-di-GMP phosphodiesterase
MPQMNRFVLYKNIKRQDPIVTTCFLTALSDLENYQLYKNEVYPKIGQRHFVFKPIETEELLCNIKILIKRPLLQS